MEIITFAMLVGENDELKLFTFDSVTDLEVLKIFEDLDRNLDSESIA